MPEAPYPNPPPALPRPPSTARERTQLEAFLVLRRNPLELWGPAAYQRDVLYGRFLGREQIMLNDPDAIRHVLVANNENYGRNIGTKRVLQPVLGSGLFLAEGAAWRHQRRTVAPALAPRTMPILARHVVLATEEAETELDRVAGGRPVELLPHLQRLALTVAGRSMFSLEMAEFGAGMRALLMRYARRYAQPGFLDLLLPASVRSPLDIGRAAFRAEWLRFVDGLIDARERQAERAPAERPPRDLFDLLAAARDPETGAGFSRAQLRDEVATLIIAGHETTAATLFWACYAAAKLPEHQERIAEEAAAADLSPGNAAAALKGLRYTRAHVDETLRLYPPAFLIVREALGPDTIAGRRIAPGTVVSVSPWVLHRHRRRWRNPDGFDPARFLPGAPPPDRYAYMPFGAGPRVCVGAQFALTEATLVLARLLRAFRIELFGSGTVVPRGFVTTQPDRPVRFLLTRRAH
ncbi:MAG: Cytochrome P450 family protein [uncultured Acetobacteraceae bacterium]|uniref:Cytochrome P450 family protein n=1 Tax=uncultured Acetobacteraceae bacterium TaxID=169975 RepID=A0A6J4HE98_9PROT|nr:MAG: Cytochrome P450 family protein [uncultured Acetobacteraceae bacterium]